MASSRWRQRRWRTELLRRRLNGGLRMNRRWRRLIVLLRRVGKVLEVMEILKITKVVEVLEITKIGEVAKIGEISPIVPSHFILVSLVPCDATVVDRLIELLDNLLRARNPGFDVVDIDGIVEALLGGSRRGNEQRCEKTDDPFKQFRPQSTRKAQGYKRLPRKRLLRPAGQAMLCIVTTGVIFFFACVA